jgi:hypothetical protein
MASYFGKRDFGDPRHNFVPRVMDYEKATGKVFVPPLWAPKEYPGQVSYPVFMNDRIPGVAGTRRGRNDRSVVPKGSQSARATLQRSSRAASPAPTELSPPETPLSSRPSSARRVSFDAAASPPLFGPLASPHATNSARSRARPSRNKPLQRDPNLDAYTAAGVAELVKAGFPPQAALAAFLKISGRTTSKAEVVQYI